MMASLLLFFITCISSASSLVVCRLSTIERVTCPDDFYCCGVDHCCKLTFEEEDDRSNESLNDWVTALCVRTVIVTMFMVLLLIIGKSIQYCRKRYFGKFCCAESSLPRYLPLEKNSIATEIGSISAILGTPFYPVNTEQVGFRGGVPMVVY